MWLDLARYADSAGYADDPPRHHLGVSRLRHQALQREQAVRPVHDRADRRRPAAEPDRGAAHRDRVPPQHDDQQRGRHQRRGVPQRRRRRSRQHDAGGLDGHVSIACAQCHTHKYDPITQKEYFRLFAIFNNTEDADRTDESPLHSFYSDAQKQAEGRVGGRGRRARGEVQGGGARSSRRGCRSGRKALTLNPKWLSAKPQAVKSKAGVALTVRDDGAVFAEKACRQGHLHGRVAAAGEKADRSATRGADRSDAARHGARARGRRELRRLARDGSSSSRRRRPGRPGASSASHCRARTRSCRWPRCRSSAGRRTSPPRARPSRAAPTTTARRSSPSTATPTAQYANEVGHAHRQSRTTRGGRWT